MSCHDRVDAAAPTRAVRVECGSSLAGSRRLSAHRSGSDGRPPRVRPWRRDSADRFAAVWSSPLRRAAETGEIIADRSALDPVGFDERLREADAGEWQGMTPDEIEAAYPGFLGRTTSGHPTFEAFEHVVERVFAALHDIAATGDPGRGPLVVATHSGVIRSVVRRLGEPDERIPNLGGVWIGVTPSERSVIDVSAGVDLRGRFDPGGILRTGVDAPGEDPGEQADQTDAHRRARALTDGRSALRAGGRRCGRCRASGSESSAARTGRPARAGSPRSSRPAVRRRSSPDRPWVQRSLMPRRPMARFRTTMAPHGAHPATRGHVGAIGRARRPRRAMRTTTGSGRRSECRDRTRRRGSTPGRTMPAPIAPTAHHGGDGDGATPTSSPVDNMTTSAIRRGTVDEHADHRSVGGPAGAAGGESFCRGPEIVLQIVARVRPTRSATTEA